MGCLEIDRVIANFKHSVFVEYFLNRSIFDEDMDKSLVICFFCIHSV